MPDIASIHRIPTGGSANWSWVVWWNKVIVPPTGMMANVRKAGTTARYGASRKTVRSA